MRSEVAESLRGGGEEGREGGRERERARGRERELTSQLVYINCVISLLKINKACKAPFPTQYALHNEIQNKHLVPGWVTRSATGLLFRNKFVCLLLIIIMREIFTKATVERHSPVIIRVFSFAPFMQWYCNGLRQSILLTVIPVSQIGFHYDNSKLFLL